MSAWSNLVLRRLEQSFLACCALGIFLLSSLSYAAAFEPTYLTGSVALADNTAPLPMAKTLIRIKLLDQSRLDAPPQILAEQILEKPQQVPAAFSLCYDKQAIKADGQYVVEAQIFLDGELRYQNPQATAVLGNGLAEHPVLLLQKVGQ